MSSGKYALKTFVHRILAWRLLLACIVIAFAFGTTAYFSAYRSIGEEVILIAKSELEWLKYRVRRLEAEQNLGLRDAAELALNQPADHDPDLRDGQFVYLRFYRSDADESLDHWPKPATPRLDRFTESLSRQLPDDHVTEVHWIDGHPHIQLAMPIYGKDGLVAYLQGLFALSDGAVSQVQARTWATVLYVVAIVLATTLLLYPVIINLTRRLARYSEDLLESNLDTLQVLGSAIAKKDSETDAHNYRVTLYSMHLAERLDLPAEQMRRLIKGAFLHDVGKIGIHDKVLLKPGRLDADEYTVMKTHVDHGIDIVGNAAWLQDAKAVVGGHHERFDGSGYPAGHKGETIPLIARIFAIADVFDALTSRRPYKKSFSLEESLQIMDEGRGSHFDPDLLDLFGHMAPALHTRYAGREDNRLKTEMQEWIEHCFSGGLETLEY